MHNNYYFLRNLSSELTKILTGGVVSECFSQSKDELIIRVETPTKPFFIKASLQPVLCCLSFPEDFSRARKNSVDLFEPLIGLRVNGATQYENERSFSIDFNNHFSLLFKMHGNRANLVLFENEKAISMFRNHLVADADISLSNLHRAIDWSYETFEKHLADLPQLYVTFGKPIWNFLNRNAFQDKSHIEQWQAVQDLLNYLKNPTYYITEIEGKHLLSLFPDGVILEKYKKPIQALNEFYHQFTRSYYLHQERSNVLATLRAKLSGSVSYLVKAFEKKRAIEKDTHYNHWADLLMANLHAVTPGMEKVSLPDFYNPNKTIEIKLKKDLSAQKNAAVFYRKSKNQQIEIQKLNESITSKEKELVALKEKITAIEAIADVKTLRIYLETIGLTKEAKKKIEPLPYHEAMCNGFKIWIGKNAQHNDTLTLKYAFKEDLWLHAKDVAGSHVVIKYQAGKPFPKEVIERAAQLAAYHSKRKTDSLCPVAYTPKKYVRKRKGDPPGAVVVEREEVILVEPKK
jgi:predicted ribosome quality control (RQC) complex YloA/Tae2 family protein